MTETARPYRVLALDGGGVRGISTIVWLARLAERHGPAFLGGVDLYAGTSMGAANAMALASGSSLDRILKFYRTGDRIFARRVWPGGIRGRVLQGVSRVPGFRWIDQAVNLFLPKWEIDGLRAELQEFFGSKRMRELDREVAIVATLLSGTLTGTAQTCVQSVVMSRSRSSDDGELECWRAVLRSMAAPVYFPSFEGYVDGGVFAVNPSLAALGVAAQEPCVDGATGQVRLLSIGCGQCPDGIGQDGPLEWGILKWGGRFPDIAQTATSGLDDLGVAEILGDRFFRFNPVLEKSPALDDFRAVDELIRWADRQTRTPEFEALSQYVGQYFLDRPATSGRN